MIRHTTLDDLPFLRDIELAAGKRFRDVGMPSISDDKPPPLAEYVDFHQADRAWVSTDAADRPVAYILVEVIDQGAHIAQVSVTPDHARRGLGRVLVETVAHWAKARGLSALTLTTFRDVPWNAPYYERLGFCVLEEAAKTKDLLDIEEREARDGLARWPRVTMRRLL